MIDRAVRVLIVDDDEEDFLILRDLLSEYPVGRYELAWAPTLAAGVEALRADAYDVFLVDYMLGPDNGLDLVRLAVSEGTAHRPVILLTGHGNAEVDREALEAGASDYLIKGQIDAEKLARSIRYAAERSRQLAEIEETKQRYRQLFERNPIPAWVFEIDSGRLIAVNDAMIANYGYSRDELMRMTIFDLRSPSEAERLRATRASGDNAPGFAGVWQHLRKDGGIIFVEVTTHDLVLDGRRCRMTIANDITSRREAQARLQLLDRAVQSSTSGVIIVDARAADFPIIFVNAAFERLTGYNLEEVVGRNCRFLQGTDVDQAELELIRHALRDATDCNVILRNYRKDGSQFWNHLFISPVRDDAGELTHFVGVQNDLTERRQVEAELSHAASHDVVTNLPRYPVLEATLAAWLDPEDARVAVFFIDLDRFHAVNESMGHVFGDEVLRQVADRLALAFAGPGQIARFAGDEFVAAVAGITIEQAHDLAQRVRGVVAEPIQGDGYRLMLTVSIGISHAPEHGRNPMDLLRRAEAAMSNAKRQGRDVVCEFSAEQMRELDDRLLLGARLREAPRRGELELHYQPLIRAGDERIIGFEALLRWSNAELGRVSPARFIPIAEALGLMSEIGHWVIDEACRQLREWNDAGLDDFTIAVNFSAQELQRPDVIALVRDALQRHAVLPQQLEIEITESSLMEHVERVVAIMAELKQIGVKLSLDDFGTGYSSLAYLKQFSLDKLKIDRSFVRDLPQDADDAAIARTIVAIGHQLRMTVVAEGVETLEQAAFLRELGCDQLQGYLFSAPLPAAKAMQLLQARAAKA
jgi:diguanylate cyclase (GGDEF)-like protein/PAS domain S-box-containing protein